jgi:hypothetical protein
MDMSGFYYLDGIDLWKAFGLVVESGSADFLRLPQKKPSITHDWEDVNGIDVDLSRIFLKEKRGTLDCAFFSYSEAEFWEKQESFYTLLTKPETRRLTIRAHGDRSYYVYYEDMTDYKQVGRHELKGTEAEHMIVHTFGLVIVEPNPKINNKHVYLVDGRGRFLIC